MSDRETRKQGDRHTDKETVPQRERERERRRQGFRQIDKLTGRQKERQAVRASERETS